MLLAVLHIGDWNSNFNSLRGETRASLIRQYLDNAVYFGSLVTSHKSNKCKEATTNLRYQLVNFDTQEKIPESPVNGANCNDSGLNLKLGDSSPIDLLRGIFTQKSSRTSSNFKTWHTEFKKFLGNFKHKDNLIIR